LFVAIEFAVTSLEVKTIVVMGHGQCGGIAAALAAADSRPVGRFIAPWVALLDGIRDQVVKQLTDAEPSARQRELERLAVRQSLNSLRSFPFVAAAEKDGELRLAGAWFAIAQGELHWLDEVSCVFEPVEA
jgi:carbonic anhydrase